MKGKNDEYFINFCNNQKEKLTNARRFMLETSVM